MKRILMLVTVFCLLLIASVSVSFADVVLTWDSYPVEAQITVFQVEVDGQAPPYTEVVPNTYGLLSLPDGSHTIRVRALNVWGESAWSDPFVFVKGVPVVPANIILKVVP